MKWLVPLIMVLVLVGCTSPRSLMALPPPTPISGNELDSGVGMTAKAIVHDAFPGCIKQTAGMLLINYDPEPATYRLEYDIIEDVMDGYSLPPNGAHEWVGFPPSVTVPAHHSQAIPVTFSIPKGTKGLPSQWEFGIRAMAEGQGGIVNIAGECTWLVTMR